MNPMQKRFKKKCYFEGWYFKQQSDNRVFAFIPGYNTDSYGNSRAFLQILMNESSCLIPFSIEDFSMNPRQQVIRLGNNYFSKKGIRIHINDKDLQIHGRLTFSRISPIRYTIMGFYKYIPFMECKHEILSMHHKVYGSITCNGKTYKFRNGTGYIEKDSGHSFPSSYRWVQCNYFPDGKCSVFLSIANISYHGIEFTGCICNILHRGREYRLATYLGVKIIRNSKNEIIIKQGRFTFMVFLKDRYAHGERESKKITGFSHNLMAPIKGEMVRTIKEQHLVPGRFLFFKDSKLIFDLTSTYISYEYVE